MKRLKKSFYNALKMLRKNIRSYVFLSVTIILSLSALLVYLVYTDSALFNEYKEIFKVSSKIAILTFDDSETKEKKNIIMNKLGEYNDTHFYNYVEQNIQLNQTTDNSNLYCNLNIIPSNVWGFYFSSRERFEMLNGSKEISLNENEIIVNESFYKAIFKDDKKEKNIEIPILKEDGSSKIFKFKVVGICRDFSTNRIHTEKDGSVVGHVNAFVSVINFNGINLQKDCDKMVLYSNNLKEILKIADSLQIANDTVNDLKENAIEQSKNSISIKRIITIALFLLLAVNLFSSFRNSLNERKFEIGIRRAIGAGKRDIITQFFMEGMIVLLVDFMISIALCVVIMCLIKIIYSIYSASNWVIKINPYSIQMFLCCSIFLTLVFSIIFAIMSVKVEIVKHLKNES